MLVPFLIPQNVVRFVQVMLYAAYYVADKHNILLHNAP
jgi:hypothetical protein